jgi:hypothetical protein
MGFGLRCLLNLHLVTRYCQVTRWRHALAWGRRSSWIHFLVTGDGGAGVFLVPWLTKFLAGQDLYWQDGEPSGGRSHASEPVSAQESYWTQKSCGHKETCDCSYFIQNTKCPTTPMSCSILKKLWIVCIFINLYLYNLYNWYPLTIINFVSPLHASYPHHLPSN